MKTIIPLTRKDLMRETNCPHYTISYLTLTQRLPIIHKADGKGDVNLYHPDAVDIIKHYLSRIMGLTDEN
ncbi:MAG: hypothetical protein ISR65_20695 [Bacteriovoracaceae bacterium]|nr:hypothetical protein [Bacteriovoracaceae bacterium]